MSIKPPKQKELYRICAETKSGKIVNINSYYRDALWYKTEIKDAVNYILNNHPKIKRENLIVFRQDWVEDKNILNFAPKKRS